MNGRSIALCNLSQSSIFSSKISNLKWYHYLGLPTSRPAYWNILPIVLTLVGNKAIFILVFSSQRIGRRGQSAMVDCSRIFFGKPEAFRRKTEEGRQKKEDRRRHPKQEARSKKQEARSKKQEARSKRENDRGKRSGRAIDCNIIEILRFLT